LSPGERERERQSGQNAGDMFAALNEFLSYHKIDLNDRLGKSYDSASAMSGRHSSVQAMVMKENQLAE